MQTLKTTKTFELKTYHIQRVEKVDAENIIISTMFSIVQSYKVYLIILYHSCLEDIIPRLFELHMKEFQP